MAEAGAGEVGLTARGGATAVAAPLPSAPCLDHDLLLVRRHLAGDPAAFEELFHRYQTPVFSLVNRMVNGENAYDLTQDVFYKALRSLKDFRGESKFSTWLFAIARTTCLSYLRRGKIVTEDSYEGMLEASQGSELPDRRPAADVERTVERRDLQRIVRETLATLRPEDRLLILLRDFEGLSYEEISQVTELSIVNVKSKLHRARIALKNRLAPLLDLAPDGPNHKKGVGK